MHSEFYFTDQVSSSKPELKKMVKALYKHLLTYSKRDKPFSLSFLLVDDKTIWEINRRYRNVDRPTDVISFAYDDDASDGDLPIDDLGEVIVSLDTAKKQALLYSHPLEREVAFLYIHGFLHLLGYDHMKSEEEAEKMFALQNLILDSFAYDYKEVS